MKRLVCVGMILGLMTGCSSMKVWTDYSTAADFNAFKTFQFKDTDNIITGANQLVHQRIVDAITREMQAKGFTKVDSDPHVYVNFYGKVSEQVVLNTMHLGYSWGPSWRWSTAGLGHTTTTVSTYDRGTLVIDVWEASEKDLVWRGTIEKTLSNNPEKTNHRLNQGIERAFRSFPPSSSS